MGERGIFIIRPLPTYLCIDLSAFLRLSIRVVRYGEEWRVLMGAGRFSCEIICSFFILFIFFLVGGGDDFAKFDFYCMIDRMLP